ncbi:hypothetical protein UFOVP264_26 [uncultured Caudovirales phage]|uniref:Uncharacterized protein n=1 Tax=uncultured Caudovirales phage TaxID=2100421 RepID=A0A6J5LGU6_9CAUD|nr:hypothetical protein UFOVP264_26 [uncultured Caudovirales phage]
MKIMLAILLTLAINTSYANVIGPNSQGIYKVDQWGSKKA